jgi:hypothetical protein
MEKERGKVMKVLRKSVIVVVLILMVGLLVFAKVYRDKKQNALWSSQWEDSLCTQFGNTYLESGILYHSGSYLRFCDNTSGKDDLICIDQSCSHKASKDSGCGAYVDCSVIGGVAIRGNHLMYIADSSDDYGMCSLYTANLEGKKRTKLGKLTMMDMVWDVLYHDNMVYVSYTRNLQDEEAGVEYGIYAYDLEERKGKKLFLEKGNGFSVDGLAMGEKMLYISYVCSDASKEDILKHSEDAEYEKKHNKSYVKGIDVSSGEVLTTLDGYGNNNILLFAQGHLFYTKDKDLYDYSEEDGTSKKINETGDLIALSGSDSGKVYFRGEDSKTQELLCFSYDIKTQKWDSWSAGDFFPEAISSDVLYGSDSSGSRGMISLEDLKKGDFSKAESYVSQWDE